jgi:hypothetical protein
MKQTKICRVCDAEFMTGDTRQYECSRGCMQIMAGVNLSAYTKEQKISAARRRYQKKMAFEFMWQRFVFKHPPGREVIFR